MTFVTSLLAHWFSPTSSTKFNADTTRRIRAVWVSVHTNNDFAKLPEHTDKILRGTSCDSEIGSINAGLAGVDQFEQF